MTAKGSSKQNRIFRDPSVGVRRDEGEPNWSRSRKLKEFLCRLSRMVRRYPDKDIGLRTRI
jgi:hypothetical protein